MTEQADWVVQENDFDPARPNRGETIFTIGNGYLCSRGAFEEATPGEVRATFLHGVFDDVPVAMSELANVPDWLELEIYLDGERFNLTVGQVLAYRRALDMQSAVLTRDVTWRSPRGRTTRLVFERFASLADEHLAGSCVSITPQDYAGPVELRAGLNVAVDNQGLKHWDLLDQGLRSHQTWLHCRTRASRVEVAVGLELALAGGEAGRTRLWDVRGHPTVVTAARARAGQTLTAQKWAVYATSRDGKNPLAEVKRRLRLSARREWERELAAHRRAWSTEWDRCDVIITGDPEAQLAVRFNLFQLLVAAPRHDEHVNIGAKTLSGFGYRGHAFWDTEIFILPFFTFTRPEIARNLLSYRFHNLAGARRKAQGNHLRGAQYPWESAGSGDEVTPTWVPYYVDPSKLVRIWTGDIEIHISADIAYAIWQYWQATGDDDFMLNRGAEVILETARFWSSRAEWVPGKDRHEFHDVIGPDENHEHVDNNFYTNAMARWNLMSALALRDWLAEHHPAALRRLARKLELTPNEFQHFHYVADHIYLAYDPQTRLIEQFDGYFQRKDVNLQQLEPRDRSVQGIFGVEEANTIQILKQPDVLMAFHLLPEAYDAETMRANYDYYSPRTDLTYGSSLGPSVQAVVAARLGDVAAAYENFLRAARADLFDVRGNSADGIHGASAGGVWQAVVFGFAGLTRTAQSWETHPCLPANWSRLAFKIMDRGKPVTIDIVR